MVKLTTIDGKTFEGPPEEVTEAIRLYESAAYRLYGEVIPTYEANPIEAPTIEATPAPAPSVTALSPLTTALPPARKRKGGETRQFGYIAPKKDVPYTRIRHERKLRDWTSYHASKQSEISGAQYGKIENAYVIALRQRQLDIAKVYGLPPNALFDYYGRAKLYKQPEAVQE